MSLDVARAAFFLAIAPLPGVESPAGRRRLIPCGKPAVDEMLRHYDELSDDQRAVFAANVRHAAPTTMADARIKPTTLSDARPAFKTWALEAKQKYLLETKTPDFPIEVFESDTLHRTYGQNAAAQTLGVDSEGLQVGPMVKCAIVLYPPISTLGEASQKEVVYHESFHCIQASLFPTVAFEVEAPGWIKEGAAEWAATTVLNQALLSELAWQEYVSKGGKSLYGRTNDALGLFAQLEHDGLEPFARMPDIITGWSVAGSERALQQAVASDSEFFSRWATSYVRKPELGSEWTLYGVGVPAIPTEEAVIEVTGDFLHEDLISPASNQWYRLELSPQVIHLRAPTGSRLRQVDGTFDSTMPFGDWCTELDGCKCPDESPFALEMLPSLPKGSYYLALPGRLKGAPWSVSGSTTERHCGREILDSCLVGTWRLVSSSVISEGDKTCAWPTPLGATLSIASTGVYTVDIASMGTISCKGSAASPAYELRFEGSGTGVFSFADHGYAAGSNDLSALWVDVSVGGTSTGKTAFTTIFGSDVLVGAGTASYTCTSNKLSIWTDLNLNAYEKL